jgi:hypothetical protein
MLRLKVSVPLWYQILTDHPQIQIEIFPTPEAAEA